MSFNRGPAVHRRAFLAGGVGAAVTGLLPSALKAAAPNIHDLVLVAAEGRASLAGTAFPTSDVWCYGDRVPGPEIRVRQGDRLRVAFENRLGESTTVHWHGIRVPNAMDGVPYLTQAPIGPGETFAYEFDPPDAGTYWYHPHQRSYEQVARGLYGALIVEEREPIPVDRDVTWVLGDWRLLRTGAISDDFGKPMETAMAGRIGNTVTVNGTIADSFAVRAGERIRLRLINAATARIFALEFRGHHPQVIATDGHPVEPHAPEGGRILLGPAMRTDLLIDMGGSPGERFTVADMFYGGLEYRLLDLAYEPERLRHSTTQAAFRLAANTVPEPEITAAEQHEITLGGGMMGGMGRMPGGMHSMGGMMGTGMAGMVWTINGVAATAHDVAPMLELRQGKTYRLALANDTAWWHPIHLHGHSFRVIARDGVPTRHREWRDTVLLAPRERVEIAFVADNPGDWMLHCHVLLHQLGGMMGVIRVA